MLLISHRGVWPNKGALRYTIETVRYLYICYIMCFIAIATWADDPPADYNGADPGSVLYSLWMEAAMVAP